jgi:DNA-binding Lrp family transcriptional regulator
MHKQNNSTRPELTHHLSMENLLLLPTNGWIIDHNWNPSISGTLTNSGIFLKILEPLFDISKSMPSAFVMISCNFGSAKDVTSQLHDIDGVEQVLIVSGIYDIIVRITVQNKDDLDRLLLRVRRMDEIQSTLTLIITQSQ